MASPRRKRAKFSIRDMAEEIVRRAQAAEPDGQLPYVVCLSDPPTPEEQLQLMACQLVGKAVAIVPWKAQTIDEWIEKYAPRST
jgi:hypothetical protein